MQNLVTLVGKERRMEGIKVQEMQLPVLEVDWSPGGRASPMSLLPALADPRHKSYVGKCRGLALLILRVWPTEKAESFPDAERG